MAFAKYLLLFWLFFTCFSEPVWAIGYKTEVPAKDIQRVDSGRREIDMGGITFVISDSWTAQVFHIVDQLSQWNEYAHRQYVRWAKKQLQLNKDDSTFLQQHAGLRRAHERQSEYVKSFLVDVSIEDAASQSVAKGLLSQEEAKNEQAILLYFSKRLSVLKQLSATQVDAFYQRLAGRKQEISIWIEKMCKFSLTQGKVLVPVYLVANPEEGSGGGEANGDRLVVECQTSPDPIPFMIHESMHFLLHPYAENIKAESDSAGVDSQVINEGLAYAMEGLIEDVDFLPKTLVENIVRGKTATDRYAQFYMAGIVFRPMLRQALQNGETIETVLPKAIKEWKRINGH